MTFSEDFLIQLDKKVCQQFGRCDPRGPDAVTVLTAKKRMAKTYQHTDGGVVLVGYDNAKHYDANSVSIPTITTIHTLALRLQHDPNSCVIRGALKEGIEPKNILRRLHDRPDGSATFTEVDRVWVSLDSDALNLDFDCDPTDPQSLQKAALWVRDHLPPPFSDTACVLSFSSGAFLDIEKGGLVFSPRKAKAHLWFVLDAPVCGDSIADYCTAHDLDPASGRTVQPIYTAGPVFDGLTDPLPQRVFLLEGSPKVTVAECDPPLYPNAEADTKRQRRITQLSGEKPAATLPTVGWLKKFRGNIKTLDIVGLFEEQGLYLRSLGSEKHAVVCPWQDGHNGSSGETETVCWHSTGEYPSFFCAHSHCANRTIQDVLEEFGVEVVDRYCEAGPPTDDWRSQLAYTMTKDGTRGGLQHTPSNISLIMAHDPAWLGVFGWDEFQNSVVLTQPLPATPFLTIPPHDRDSVTESDVFAARCWLNTSEYRLNVPENSVMGAIDLTARSHAFHPIRNYLDGLAWDGNTRIDTWLATYLGVLPQSTDPQEKTQEAQYICLVGAKWLIQAVARIYRPGCKADYVLILEGEQGVQKSTALSVLALEKYFNDTPFHIGDKDAYLALQNTWIYEIGELDSLMRAESSAAKAFFSSAFDKYRPPYGRTSIQVPRQCVFAGTVNGDEYLKDRSGGRRYWPVWCTRIDLEALRRDRDQLWGEAVARFKAGGDQGKWWPIGQDQDQLMSMAQEARVVDDPWEAKIANYLTDRTEVTVSEVLTHALEKKPDNWTRQDQTRIGQLMMGWGWRRARVWQGRNRVTMYSLPPKKG